MMPFSIGSLSSPGIESEGIHEIEVAVRAICILLLPPGSWGDQGPLLALAAFDSRRPRGQMGASDVPDCDVAGHGKALVSGRTASGEHLTAREAQAWKQPHTSGSPSAAVTGVDRSPYRHG